MLTKVQRLEVENRILWESITDIKKALEELNKLPLGKRYSGTAPILCLGHIDAAVNIEKYLETALKAAEAKEKPRQQHKGPGKSKETSMFPL